jgi:hypothetical protein
MTNKRSELASILRRLADYIDRHPDEELAPIFEQAARLMPSPSSQKRNQVKPLEKLSPDSLQELAAKLRELMSREDGENLLLERITNRQGLESLARFLQLPVQRDDSVERLRAKIIENTIGSRLRSSAIQG